MALRAPLVERCSEPPHVLLETVGIAIPLSALARGKCLCGTFSRGVKGAVNGFEYDSRDQSTTEAYGARRITGRGL